MVVPLALSTYSFLQLQILHEKYRTEAKVNQATSKLQLHPLQSSSVKKEISIRHPILNTELIYTQHRAR